MLASAMSPHDALRVATLDGARMLGVDAQLGSLETGKLADLMVIDGNPLADMARASRVPARAVEEGASMMIACGLALRSFD